MQPAYRAGTERVLPEDYRCQGPHTIPFIGFDRLSCPGVNLLPCDQGQYSNLTLRYRDLFLARVFTARQKTIQHN